MDRYSLSFSPFLPWPVIAGLVVLALLLVAAALIARQRGAWLRLVAFACMLAALANPALVALDRDKLNDIVAVVVDRSGSQTIGDRMRQTDTARDEVLRQLNARPGTDVRVIDIEEREADQDGTRLFEGLQAGLSDLPSERLAGVIAITDGRAHDAPASARALGLGVPMHALITGRADERDRRIEIVEGPRFGIVGKDVQIALRVVDTGIPGQVPANIVIRRGGQIIGRRVVAAGQLTRFPLRIENAGPNLIEIEAEQVPNELTALNNVAVLPIEGVRDKLKVLLVSGEPHAGERTWRNLLKADSNVELVHFTILRPPEKQDGTPINELALIAFPTRDLFVTKIAEFDLIIFDRYANQSILPSTYFENIARYVRDGGAVLLASGSEFAGPGTLASTPLRQILAATPTGEQIERPYLPRVSTMGERHPVTRALPGWKPEGPEWAPWFRLVQTRVTGGQPIMSGPGDAPLLVLHRVGKGRVAQLLSDHAWLWARGLGEGGPYLDLLRRLVHWQMKEPELEEEALRLTARGRGLLIERQTLAETTQDVRLIGPDGEEFRLTLAASEPGLWRANFTARRSGLHRVTDGERVAFANVGPANPREFRDVASSEEPIRAVVEETGGSVRRLDQSGRLVVPRIVDIRSGSRFGGNDFIGLKPAEAYVVKGVGLLPLALGGIGLLLLLGSLLLAWLGEGRRRLFARAA
jgi:hypothetical protein